MTSNRSFWIFFLTLLFVVAGQALSWLPARMVLGPSRPWRRRRNPRRKGGTGDDTTPSTDNNNNKTDGDDDDKDDAKRSFLSFLPWWWEDSWSDAFLNSLPIRSASRAASLAATTKSSSSSSSMEPDNHDIDIPEDELSHYQTPKPNSEASVLHFCFLLHGHRGYSTDLTYLQRGMQHYAEQEKEKRYSETVHQQNIPVSQTTTSQQQQQQQEDMIVHCANCNEGKTADGVINGGERLVQEILHVIRSELRQREQLHDEQDQQDTTAMSTGKNINGGGDNSKKRSIEDITISIVGNSLGGIYGRYAIAKLTEHLGTELNNTIEGKASQASAIPGDEHVSTNENSNTGLMPCTVLLDGKYRLHFNIFCTTATPHLGISKHTFVPLPRSAEIGAAYVLGETGRDLFRLNDVMKTMATSPEFLEPLRKFRKRVAFANAYATDFPVPASTAAFLSEDSTYPHHFSDKATSENSNGGTDWKKIDEDNKEGRIIATLHTHQAEASPHKFHSVSGTEIVDDLVQMSNSLDSLGWTKVFIDIRKEIPLGVSVSIPKSLRSGITRSLLSSSTRLILGNANNSRISDDLTTASGGDINVTTSPQQANEAESNVSVSVDSSDIADDEEALPRTAIQKLREKGVVESRDVASAVSIPEDMRFHIPIGHNLMVAKDGGVVLGSLYKGGRPVMDALAKRLVEDIFGWSLEKENEAAGKTLTESSVDGDVSYSNLF